MPERFSPVSQLRRALIGAPLPTSAHAEERFNNAEALAILSSDALSSVAYATQEIVLVLGLAGAAALPGCQATLTGILPIRACHSRGPVVCTLVPWASTATVTGMSLTSNS